MPAKTMIFDQRVRTLHDFGAAPVNTILFNPQGRLVLLAGFGNLAGKIDVFDRRTLQKVCTIDAPNTSHCEWSPDGRFLMTATLSPRLRVDNGIKVWHCSGPLMHVQACDELYQVSWRPAAVDSFPPFGQAVPPPPVPGESVKNFEAGQKPTPSKPAGAYRPPGARGLATPAIFKREDEGGAPRVPTNGTSTPPRVYNRSPVPPGAAPNGNGNGVNGYHHQHNGSNGGRRQVPGAAQNPAPSAASAGVGDGDRKNARKRKGKKDSVSEKAVGLGDPGKEDGQENGGMPESVQQMEQKVNGSDPPIPEDVLSPLSPDGSLDPTAKKVRNLNKKVGRLYILLLRIRC
jgi:translation initiation factor 2A